MKMFHVVIVNNKTDRKVYMTATPVTHDEACTILSKLTRHPWRREMVEAVRA